MEIPNGIYHIRIQIIRTKRRMPEPSGIIPLKFVHSSAETLEKHKFLQLHVHEWLLLHRRFL